MNETLGKYTLVRKLATGGMAEVFLANIDGPGGFQKQVVVKRILPHFAQDESFVAMFLGEATLAAQLNHSNLVQIFDFGHTDGQYFLAMEYIDGPNLRSLAKVSREHSGPMPIAIAAKLVSHAAEGLHHAHELKDKQGHPMGLVHRDVSPDNVLLSRSGAVKVVDFGIAKATTAPSVTRSGVIKGKLAYMPPEQLQRQPVDRRADVYSLGMVLYELLSGEMPFDASSEVSIIQAVMGERPFFPLPQRRPEVPATLSDIVNRCLEKDPSARFETAKALQVELERFLSVNPVSSLDLAALVEVSFPQQAQPLPLTTLKPTGATFEKTHQRTSDAEIKVETGASKVSSANTEAFATAEAVAASGATSKRPLILLLGLLFVLLASGVGVLLWPKAPTTPLLLPPAPVVGGSVATAQATKQSVDEPALVQPILDAGSVPEVSLDAGLVESHRESVGPTAKPPTGKLSFRIRPFATVFVDGKFLGETPLSTQNLTLGRHKLRVVNETLHKDLAVEVVVKPGENVFKLNLKE